MTNKVPVNLLDGSTATTGDVPTRQADGSVDWAAGSGGGGGSSLPWFTVTDAAYGATADGTTDDTAAINAAITALNTAGRGVLYFPAGKYLVSAALTTITVPAMIRGDGASDTITTEAPTTIICTSATANLLTIGTGAQGVTIRDLALLNTAATTPTAGAGIRINYGEGFRIRDVSTRDFWIGIDVEDGREWYMHGCYFYGPVKYGLRVAHVDLPDGGDAAVSDCQFVALNHDADAAIYQPNGGGLKVTNTKINGTRPGDTHRFTRGVDISIDSTTGILLLSTLSIENIATNGIRVTEVGAGSFQGVVMDGIQVGFYQAGTTPAIDVSLVRDVTLDGLVLFAYPDRACPAVQLTSVDNVAVGDRITRGFTTGYTATTSTNVVDGMAGGGAVTSVNGETGAVVLDAADVGAAAASHTHGSSGGELLMQDGVTSPPVPLETEDGSDWLYEG